MALTLEGEDVRRLVRLQEVLLSPLDEWAQAIEGMVMRMEPEGPAFSSSELEAARNRRQKAGLDVWSNRMVVRMLDRQVEDFSFYHEFFVPAGTLHGGP
ncbi:MAG: hypothetical protein WEA09_08515 [Gemmatimonadota bacterium]